MAAIVQAKVGIKETGETASVPDHPKAKLMYYLHCVITVLKLRDSNIDGLTDYNNYRGLSEPQTDALLRLVSVLSPGELKGKVFFQNEDLGTGNTFFELEHVANALALSGTVVVGGQSKRVAKIMMYKANWLQRNYIQPMKSYERRLGRIRRGQPGWERDCTIL